MSSFSILMRLQIRNRLAVLRGGGLRGTDGKLKTGKLVGGVFILLAYLMILGMVVGFEFLLFEGLKAIGQPELLLSMALTVVMAGMVFMSFFYVLTSLYYGRDTAFLASLPVTSRTVFGTKLTEILLGETGIAALALLPAIILYSVRGGVLRIGAVRGAYQRHDPCGRGNAAGYTDCSPHRRQPSPGCRDDDIQFAHHGGGANGGVFRYGAHPGRCRDDVLCAADAG